MEGSYNRPYAKKQGMDKSSKLFISQEQARYVGSVVAKKLDGKKSTRSHMQGEV